MDRFLGKKRSTSTRVNTVRCFAIILIQKQVFALKYQKYVKNNTTKTKSEGTHGKAHFFSAKKLNNTSIKKINKYTATTKKGK